MSSVYLDTCNWHACKTTHSCAFWTGRATSPWCCRQYSAIILFSSLVYILTFILVIYVNFSKILYSNKLYLSGHLSFISHFYLCQIVFVYKHESLILCCVVFWQLWLARFRSCDHTEEVTLLNLWLHERNCQYMCLQTKHKTKM